MKVDFISAGEIGFEQYKEIFELTTTVWPPKEPKTVEEEYKELKNTTGTKPAGFSVVHNEDGRLLATAFVEERIIGTENGDLSAMALGSVCSHPDARGKGCGAMAVQKVFELVDNGVYPVCLFQTSFKVEPFYLKLNAKRITNRMYNSNAKTGLTPKKMRRQIFWDDIVMIYPADYNWPTGGIDMRGPGY